MRPTSSDKFYQKKGLRYEQQYINLPASQKPVICSVVAAAVGATAVTCASGSKAPREATMRQHCHCNTWIAWQSGKVEINCNALWSRLDPALLAVASAHVCTVAAGGGGGGGGREAGGGWQWLAGHHFGLLNGPARWLASDLHITAVLSWLVLFLCDPQFNFKFYHSTLQKRHAHLATAWAGRQAVPVQLLPAFQGWPPVRAPTPCQVQLQPLLRLIPRNACHHTTPCLTAAYRHMPQSSRRLMPRSTAGARASSAQLQLWTVRPRSSLAMSWPQR